MLLDIKKPDRIIPSYSLTGDLLSYIRCRLSYRYYNGSSLPPSRPVQQWYGEFLHGTLELAYRFWLEHHDSFPLPWPCTKRPWHGENPVWATNDIGQMGNTIEYALLQQGKQARNRDVRDTAYIRVNAVINRLGNHLFPLIVSAEKKVIGTRSILTPTTNPRSSNYEVHGVIDVLTHMTLDRVDNSNLIKNLVQQYITDDEGDYEVIVDYKGSHRPNTNDNYWEQGKWQLLTYAWLRSKQPDAKKVVAGILIYANELTPGTKEMHNLKAGIQKDTTDIVPEKGSRDEQVIRMWRDGNSTDQISDRFRFLRTIRVIPISDSDTQVALHEFDRVVDAIEQDVLNEALTGDILKAWSPNCTDQDMCTACDFRYLCPCKANDPVNYAPKAPPATVD